MRPYSKLFAALLIAATAFTVGCGTPGAPQPPSLHLPRLVDDLAAQRKGGRIVLSWTQPTETTDRQLVRRAGTTRICRSAGPLPVERCNEVVAELSPQQVAQFTTKSERPRVVFEQKIATSNIVPFATFSIEAFNERGRSAGLSNQVVVPAVPILAAPEDLRAEVGPAGVVLRWTGIAQADAPKVPDTRYAYKLFRRVEGAVNFTPVAEAPLNGGTLQLLDNSFEWERTYDYRVESTTHLTVGEKTIDVEGDDSAPVRVVARDTFPPATPTGLQAVFSGVGQEPFIDLSWAPATDSDLAGYHIYRHEAGAAPVRIDKEPVKVPTFRDSQVQFGRKYWYSVTALDLRNNESTRSDETSEVIPKDRAND